MDKEERRKLYAEAKKARDECEPKKAYDIYKVLNDTFPNDWEAFFYMKCTKLYACSLDEIVDVATDLYKSEETALKMINSTLTNPEKIIETLSNAGVYLENIAIDISDTAFDTYEKSEKREYDRNALINMNVVATNILTTFCNLISKEYDGELGAAVWADGQYLFERDIDIKSRILPFLKGKEKREVKKELQTKINLVKQYKPNYNNRLPRFFF